MLNRNRLPIALGLASVLSVCGAFSVHAAEIKIVINQSPWLDGFKKTAEKYEQQTGETVTIDAVPFAGVLEKVRGSLRASQGVYDITMMDVNWIAEVYSGGFLTPIQDISANYTLPENVLDFDGAVYWDKTRNVMNAQTGQLMAFPVTGNPQLLYYRKDVFENLGLQPPKNWDELKATIEKLNAAGATQYSFLAEGGIEDVLFRFTPYLLSAGGGIFKNATEGDYTVILNSAESIQALEFYLSIVKAGGYPTPASLTQGELIQLYSTGKVAMSGIVAAARGPLTNPDSSIVGDMLAVSTIPAPAGKTAYAASGHWLGGIARNISDEQKKASFAFLDWLMKKENQVFLFEAGGVPVRSDLAGSANDPLNFLPVLAESIASSRMVRPVKVSAQVNTIVGRYINEALLGNMDAKAALDGAAAEITALMTASGYDTAAKPNP